MYMSKISNILKMISLLNSGKKYTIHQLAEELEISERMVRQYKDELEIAGIYISTIKGPYGGYVLDNHFPLPVLRINTKDIELLSNGKEESKKPILEKLKLIVEEYDYNKIDTSSNKFNCFQRAIKNKQKVKIVYNSINLGASERIIQPLEMFLFSKNWYVVAFCELRHDMRNFAFDNIESYEILDENF